MGNFSVPPPVSPMKPPGRAIEIRVLELIRRRSYFLEFRSLIRAEFFTSSATRRIYEEIEQIHNETSPTRIPHVSLAAILNVREADGATLREEKQILNSMQRLTRRVDYSDTRKIVLEWTKKALTKEALYEGLDLLERGNGSFDIRSLQAKIDSVAKVGVPKFSAYNYNTRYGNRLSADVMKAPIGTGIPSLDYLLEGGVDIGEVGLFIGPTHRGKTRALVNVGVHALRQGKHVCHIIVSDSNSKRIARRYDSVLCDKLFSVIRENPEILEKRLKRITKAGGHLVIKEYDTFAPTPSDLRMWLKEYAGFIARKIDVLIIDYLDEMKSDTKYREYRLESRDLTSSLRRLGAEFRCPIWTASQGNRQSMSKHVVGLDDVAEDVWKSNVSDVVITINQTDEEKQERVLRYKLAKARRERFEPKLFHLEVSEAGRIREVEIMGGSV